VLTDRIDLDDQISKTFVACGLPNPTQCGSVAGLRDAVNRGGNGQILLSTIFKFAGSKEAIPNSANWIVLVDECHRTQEKDLGAFLQATLPDAHFYGFTGTPIKSTDKDTYARFSIAGEGYLDKYGIDDAVRDGRRCRSFTRAGKPTGRSMRPRSTSCSTAGLSICPTTSARN
jgi:type I restriction enzyme R subunit